MFIYILFSDFVFLFFQAVQCQEFRSSVKTIKIRLEKYSPDQVRRGLSKIAWEQTEGVWLNGKTTHDDQNPEYAKDIMNMLSKFENLKWLIISPSSFKIDIEQIHLSICPKLRYFRVNREL